jgi:hypothetical protein
MTADEILAAATPPTRLTKLERWMQAHPEEGEIYLEVMRRGLAAGLTFQHLHKAAQAALSGPPVSTQRAKLLVADLLAAD